MSPSRPIRLLRRLALVLAPCTLLGASAVHAAPPDVRILIDVSGSMKQNDPANLRVPALKLLTELLPSGATAGVWLFDEQTVPLIPPGPVDADWKKQARAAADRIHSQGQFTHIEAGLDAATADWKSAAAPDTPRHVILLTDGMVDVSTDAQASAASRARLLADGLTRFQVIGAHVNAVALSDAADSALLGAIAQGTDGWFQQIDDASALQRVFLHLFEQAAAPDGLPLQGNRFTVDTSVRELTLLVFHAANASPLELTTPDGAVLREADAGDALAWHHEAGYDLVTIAAPRAGQWSFNAPDDPDNRALVVTDLALAVDDQPTHLMPGEPLAVGARLLEQGIPLARPDFLRLVKADAAISGAEGAGDLVTLPLDPENHVFQGAVTATAPGAYDLVVRVDGGTFQREVHRRFQVAETPIDFKVDHARDDQGARVIHLTVAANPELVRPETFSGLLELHMPGHPARVLEMPPLDGHEITLELPADAAGDYVLQPWVFAESRAARALKFKPDPLTVTFGDGERPASEPAPAADAAPALPTPPPLPPPFSWMTMAGVVLVGNLGLGSALGGLWFALRQRVLPSKGLSI
ncbi:MAG: VWA domain-containing protein [Gammaproteobacteria bacterium]